MGKLSYLKNIPPFQDIINTTNKNFGHRLHLPANRHWLHRPELMPRRIPSHHSLHHRCRIRDHHIHWGSGDCVCRNDSDGCSRVGWWWWCRYYHRVDGFRAWQESHFSRKDRLPGRSDDHLRWHRPSSYSVRKDLVYTITEHAKGVIEWLEGQGVKMTLITNNLFYGQSNYRMHIAEGGGNGLTTTLIKKLEADSNVQILVNTPAVELAVKDGVVIGAFIKRDNDKMILVEAANTILATSGFAANKAMLEEYIPVMVNAYPLVAPGATGEGIIWGQNLGAGVANMKAYQGHGVFSEKFGASVDLNILYRGGILVNKEGFRFTNEHKGYSVLSPEVLAQPTGHVYMVFNQANAEQTAMFAKYEEKDILIKADTIADLGKKLNINAANFEASVADFENGIAKGQDSLNRSLFP